MASVTTHSVKQLIKDGYEFRMAAYFSRGYKLFVRNPLPYVGYTLFLASFMLLGLIPIVGSLLLVFFSIPLGVGLSLAYHNRAVTGQTEKFGDFFRGLTKIRELILLSVVMVSQIWVLLDMLFSLDFSLLGFFSSAPIAMSFFVAMIPEEIFGIFEGGAVLYQQVMENPIAVAFSVLWGLVTLTLFRWTPLFVFLHQMKVMDAVDISSRIVWKHFGMHFLFVSLLTALSMLGISFFFLGFLVAHPIVKAIDYAAFEDITHSLDVQGKITGNAA